MRKTKVPVVIVGGSGGGKTTLLGLLRERNYVVCPVVTTRSPRGDADDDENFRFVKPNEFESMVLGSRFLFWDELYGARYGLLRSDVARSTAFTVPAWRGEELAGVLAGAMGVHLLSPAPNELARRISNRPGFTAETLRQRVEDSRRQNDTRIPGFIRIEPRSIADLREAIERIVGENGSET